MENFKTVDVSHGGTFKLCEANAARRVLSISIPTSPYGGFFLQFGATKQMCDVGLGFEGNGFYTPGDVLGCYKEELWVKTPMPLAGMTIGVYEKS